MALTELSNALISVNTEAFTNTSFHGTLHAYMLHMYIVKNCTLQKHEGCYKLELVGCFSIPAAVFNGIVIQV